MKRRKAKKKVLLVNRCGKVYARPADEEFPVSLKVFLRLVVGRCFGSARTHAARMHFYDRFRLKFWHFNVEQTRNYKIPKPELKQQFSRVDYEFEADRFAEWSKFILTARGQKAAAARWRKKFESRA